MDMEAPTRASAIGTEVSAERHKSDRRSTAGVDQQGIRICGLKGAALVAVVQCRLWLLAAARGCSGAGGA